MASSSTRIPHEQVHEDLDPLFLLDYTLFSGAFRYYVAMTLHETYLKDSNDLHRRLFALGVFREEHSAYEDLGAVIDSLIRLNRGELKHLIEGLIRFKDDSVVLDTLFRRRSITSGRDLYTELNLGELIPDNWDLIYPRVNCESALQRVCRFVFNDCQTNQKRHGVAAYNKIKHGLLLVPNTRLYDRTMPDAPGAIIPNQQIDSNNPYALLAISMSDQGLRERFRLVEFVQSSLRTIVALYLIRRYPDAVKKRLGLKDAAQILSLEPMAGVMDFLQQLCEKPEPGDFA